jgi:hypothetical protein
MRMERGDHAQTTIVLTLPAARDPDSAQKPRIIGVSRP